jgi:hypothetical protein
LRLAAEAHLLRPQMVVQQRNFNCIADQRGKTQLLPTLPAVVPRFASLQYPLDGAE